MRSVFLHKDSNVFTSKEEKADNSGAVTLVETDHFQYERATFQARRHRRRILCISLIVLVVIATLAFVMVVKVVHHLHECTHLLGHHHNRHHHHHHNHHRHGEYENDMVYPVDYNDSGDREERPSGQPWIGANSFTRLHNNVWVDFGNQLIRVKLERDYDQPPVYVLYAYKSRVAAYKDFDRKVCFITSLDEAFEEGYQRWQLYEETLRELTALNVTERPIQVTVGRYGTHVEGHCREAISFWAKELDGYVTVTRVIKI